MTLTERLTRDKPLLLDGAMGTQLAVLGLEMGGQNSLSHPDEVRSVHDQYTAAGVDILITNTLTMNGIYIDTHAVGIDVAEVNRVEFAAVGVNCGELDPFETAAIVALMKEAVDLPVLAQPNAGKPRLTPSGTEFDMLPEQFVEGMRECLNAGATLVGGCCGTSSAHIRALADLLAGIENGR